MYGIKKKRKKIFRNGYIIYVCICNREILYSYIDIHIYYIIMIQKKYIVCTKKKTENYKYSKRRIDKTKNHNILFCI